MKSINKGYGKKGFILKISIYGNRSSEIPELLKEQVALAIAEAAAPGPGKIDISIRL